MAAGTVRSSIFGRPGDGSFTLVRSILSVVFVLHASLERLEYFSSDLTLSYLTQTPPKLYAIQQLRHQTLRMLRICRSAFDALLATVCLRLHFLQRVQQCFCIKAMNRLG